MSFKKYRYFYLNKSKFNFKFHDAITWLKNNYNTHIAKYLEK